MMGESSMKMDVGGAQKVEGAAEAKPSSRSFKGHCLKVGAIGRLKSLPYRIA